MIKNGTRLQSHVCDTQIIVVKATDSLGDLRNGGVAMLPLDAQPTGQAEADPDFAAGTKMGARYVSADGAEVLVTRAGVGSLSIGQTPLTIKAPKPLPASD